MKKITTKFLNSLVDAFYDLPENVVESTKKSVKALQQQGFNASEIVNKKYAKGLKLPFVVIPPEGDEHSWLTIETEEDRMEFLEDYEDMEYELGSIKSIAIQN